MSNFFIFITSNLYKFTLFLQIFNIKKSNIQILYYCLGHLYIDNIIKLILISNDLKILESIIKLFYKIYIFAK